MLPCVWFEVFFKKVQYNAMHEWFWRTFHLANKICIAFLSMLAIVSALLDVGATSEGVLLVGWWLVDIHDYISKARFQTLETRRHTTACSTSVKISYEMRQAPMCCMIYIFIKYYLFYSIHVHADPGPFVCR
jgi:hypothetical protein